MIKRVQQLVRMCRNRCGSCQCGDQCEASKNIAAMLQKAIAKAREAEKESLYLQRQFDRVTSPVASLVPNALDRCPPGYEPVLVADGVEATFGFEHPETQDWIPEDWPFTVDFVFPEDCAACGIRYEQA